MRGSYTIEAAFVMSIGLFAMLSLLFLAFYLHDVQALKAEMKAAADRAAAEGLETEQIEELLEEKLGELRLFFMKLGEREISGTSGWQQRIYFPIPAYSKVFFQSTIRDGTVQIETVGFCPERFIRQTEAVKEVVE